MKLARCLIGYAVLAAVGVTAGWLAARFASADHPGGEGRAASMPVDRRSVSFSIRGSVDNLALGQPRSLRVSVANPNPWPITIRTIMVVPDDASSTCPAAGNIRIERYDSSVPGAPTYQVPSHQAVNVALRVVVVDDPARSQDACKNLSFRLHYTGTAKAG